MEQTPLYSELDLGEARPLNLDDYVPGFWESMGNAFKSALAYNPIPSMQRWADTHPDLRAGSVLDGMDDFAVGGSMGIVRDALRDPAFYGGVPEPPAAPATGYAASVKATYAAEVDSRRIERMPVRWQSELIEKEGLTGQVKPHPDYDERALRIVIDGKKRQLDEERIAQAAPGWHAPFSLVAGLAAGLVDPVALASSFVPAVPAARVLSLLSRASGSFFKRQLVRAGIGAANAATGSAILEPVIYSGQQAMQADYGICQSLLNIGMGAALGAALHPAAGAVQEWWAKRADIHLPWQMGRATPQSLAMQDRLARAIQETRLAANPLQDAEQVRKTSLADAMTYDAAMRRLAWEQGIETHEAWALNSFRLENGERLNQIAKSHEASANALEQELAGLAEREALAAALPELGIQPADSWRVRRRLEDARLKAREARAAAARDMEELLGSDSNFARYLSSARTVEEFVARVADRNRARQGSYYTFDDRSLQREDGRHAGFWIQLEEYQVAHIRRRHPDFNNWNRIPDVVDQGICLPLKPSGQFEPGAEAYAATLDNGKVMLVIGHPRQSKNRGNRFEIHTAFIDSPGAVFAWFKKNVKNLEAFEKEVRIPADAGKGTKASAILNALPALKKDASGTSAAGSTDSGRLLIPETAPELSTGIEGYPLLPRSKSANPSISPAKPKDIHARENPLANGGEAVNQGNDGGSAGGPDTLAQRAADGDRIMGAITFAADFEDTGSAVIRIFEGHDSTTARHELAHLLRRTYGRIVKSGAATEALARHYRKLEREFGVEPGGSWNEAQEERFAEAFVNFIAEGRAPGPALQTAFCIMREQAGAMYADADAAGVRISESMRDLFNSMLTTPLEEGDRLFRTAVADINTRRWEQEFLPADSGNRKPGQALGLDHEPSEAAEARALGRPALDPGGLAEADKQLARLGQLNEELRAANDLEFARASGLPPEMREQIRNERDAAISRLDGELDRLPEDEAVMERYVACLLA